MPQSNRTLVAAPDTADSKALMRLAVTSAVPGAQFSFGTEKAPGGQALHTLYITAGDTLLSIDLDSRRATLVSGDGDTLQAVTYDIDAAAMTGAVVTVGEKFDVVFNYDGLFIDQTLEVDKWLVATGAQHSRIANVVIDSQVAEFNDKVATAVALHRSGHATRAPRSAQLIPNLPDLGDADHGELHVEDPQPIQATDPITGKVHAGRKWQTVNGVAQTTSINDLVGAGYLVTVVKFHDGSRAILLPNFKPNGRTELKGLGVQVFKHGHQIDRILDLKAQADTIGPHLVIDGTAISDFHGDTTKGGAFVSPRIDYVIGLGPAVELGVDPGYTEVDDLMLVREGAAARSDYALGA